MVTQSLCRKRMPDPSLKRKGRVFLRLRFRLGSGPTLDIAATVPHSTEDAFLTLFSRLGVPEAP
jgi:hypothetical protein